MKSRIAALRFSVLLTFMICTMILLAFCFTIPAKAAQEEFQIGIFFMPTWNYTNATQYDYIRDANVNLIQTFYPNDVQISSVAQMNTVLGLAGSRGIKVEVSDLRTANVLGGSPNADIDGIVNTYKNHPATGGYYVKDEPVAGLFPQSAYAYQRFLLKDPDSVPNVNLVGGSVEFMNSWVKSAGASNLKYLNMDAYPFYPGGTLSSNYYQAKSNLRSAGLSNNVKTGIYLQSVGLTGTLDRPNANQLRWNVYNDLAYGVKAIYWFTWFQPVIPNHPSFTTAIMDANGNKTDLYTPVQTLNGEVKKLGPTLMGLTSRDVYFKGTVPSGSSPLPANFIWQPTTAYDQIISHFANANGRSYIMVVNRDYVNSRTLSFNLSSKPTAVTEVSKSTGAEVSTNYSNATGNISASFLPGEGKLYAISADYALTALTVDDTDLGITYSGTWTHSISRAVGDYSNDVHHTSTNNDYFQYNFNGTGVDFVTETDPSGGNVDMYIDGVFQQTISTYGAVANKAQQTVYSKIGLTNGPHTIKGVKKTGTYMLLDTLKITPGNVIRNASKANDTNPGITYSGSGWGYSAGRGVGNFKNDVHYTTANNDYFEYTFTGTGVDYLAETDPSGGNVDIYIDNVFQQTVSTVGAKVPNWVSCANEGAACNFSGTKTVRFGANGKYNSGSFTSTVACTTAVFGDPILGTLKTCEYDNSAVQKQNWATCAIESWQCNFSGTRTVRYGASGAYNSGTYTNSVACTTAVFGDPIVGTAKTCEYNTINGIPTNKTQQTIYSKTGLTYGTHTIKGVKKSGTYMLLDGFNENTGSNLLVNPGFESGTGSWGTLYGGTLTADTVNKRTGTNGGKITARANPASSPSQNLASLLIANGKGNYNLSGWFKSAAGTADNAQLAIILTDSTGNHWVSTDFKAINNTEWTQSSKLVNITWQGTLTSAYIYAQTEGYSHEMYLDDLVLTR